jgi:hypothetical protein
MLSNKYSPGQDTIIAGFDDFSVIANANGSCTESSPCQGSQYWGNFNQTYTGRANQSDGSDWFFSGGGASDNQYQSMLNRIIRGSGWDFLANDVFEYRWTYEDDNYAFNAYGNGSLIRVPFEVWNVTKGFRLLVWMLDYDFNLKFGLHANDHPGSSSSDDPYTDWIYPRMPVDLTPGEQGYQNWLQASIDAGVAMGGQSTPDANGLYLGQYDHDTNSGIDYYAPSFTGNEVMGRNIWYVWNLDDVSDGTIDAYSGNDADGDGWGDNTGMEKGTVVQITLGSVKYDEFSWRDSILTDEVYIDNSNLSDTLIISWNASRSNSHGVHDYKLYIDGALLYNYSGISSTSIYGWFWHRFTYQDFLDLWPLQFQMLPRKTFTFDVWAYLNGDSLQVSNKRYVFVNRYDYLSTESEGIPTEFALHENYPNPFNPTATLRFDLPDISDVTLTIYNMLGQKVRTFKMQSTSAGYHSVTWDATNDFGEQVGAGVYLYQLQTKDFVKTRKMVLLK